MTKSKTRASFDWADPMLFNQQLTEEERLIRDTARDFSQDKLMPRVLEANRNEVFDREIMNEFGEFGFWVRPFRKNMEELEQVMYRMV